MVAREMTPRLPMPSRETQAAIFGGLALSAAVELLVLRSFTRTAVHIPALEQMAEPYKVIATMGRSAYYVAGALMVVAAVLMVRLCWAERRGATWAAASGVAVFLAAAAWGVGGGANSVGVDVATLGAVGVVAGAGAAADRRRGAMVMLVLFGLAFAASGAHTTLQAAAQERIAQVRANWLLDMAEILAIGFAVATPLALLERRPGRLVQAAGVTAGVLTFAMLVGSGSTTRILLLWNHGLAGTLPAVAYAFAAGGLAATIAGLVRQGDRMTAAGIVLMLAGGIGLHNTYQSGLVVVGLAMVCLASSTRSKKLRETA